MLFFKPDNFDNLEDIQKIFADSMTEKQREQAFLKVKQFVEQIKDDKRKVKIYCENRVVSCEVMMMLRQELLKYKPINDNNIFIDGRLNAIQPVETTIKPNFKQYEDNVFDSVCEMIMSSDDNDIVFILAGDDFWTTCQRVDRIHNFIYFGDETLSLSEKKIKKLAKSTDLQKIEETIDSIDYDKYLISTKSVKPLTPEKIIMEKAEIDFNNHRFIPVSLKFAKEKLYQKIEEELLKTNEAKSL